MDLQRFEEKTFEELINGLYSKNTSQIVPFTDLYALLKYVRKSTISECFRIIEEIEDMETAYNYSNFFNEMKRDRIETENVMAFEEGDENDLPF